ncbi:MAG: hypothetical protein LBJ60_02470 [Tannerellaceae bacterium]|jgi:hypothetical protein|nr:hypothetical protein [Tannerellaceae bacterium]
MKPIKGMPQFSWMEEILARFESTFKLRGTTTNIVGFEQNPYLKGLNLFSDIFNAVVNKQTLRISYQKFGKESKEYIFHPYFLKQDIIARWQNLDKEKSRTRLDQSFFVPADKIRANNYDLSINKYKETVYEQKRYDAPEMILERLGKLDSDIMNVRKELEGMLKTGGSHE